MSALVDYFRCPADVAPIGARAALSEQQGFFKFGDAIAFARVSGATPAAYATDPLPDVAAAVTTCEGRACLPFDLTEAVTNLRRERYRQNGYSLLHKSTTGATVERLYYHLRPYLGVGVRRHLQKARLRGWDRIAFPQWPVDRSVDVLMERSLAAVLKAGGQPSIPFVWFWPDGAPACGMVTHDVEGQAGLDSCDMLMDVDDSYGIKSAFQLIPEGRENEWRRTAARLRQRGFEVNLHDLNHDGRLFSDKAAFPGHARRINDYTREFGCEGFRSGAMYREQDWFDAFDFSYDMSVPNAAHLEPQRGGCCTIMPYFIGHILELPLTMAQDYSLFHILDDYSTALWKEQSRIITEHHGLISVITHPDYLIGKRERDVYHELLRHLTWLRDREGVWMALPSEINRWWRDRQEMTVTCVGGRWRVDGPDSNRARVAFATLDGDRVAYSFEQVPDVDYERVGAPV